MRSAYFVQFLRRVFPEAEPTLFSNNIILYVNGSEVGVVYTLYSVRTLEVQVYEIVATWKLVVEYRERWKQRKEAQRRYIADMTRNAPAPVFDEIKVATDPALIKNVMDALMRRKP